MNYPHGNNSDLKIIQSDFANSQTPIREATPIVAASQFFVAKQIAQADKLRSPSIEASGFQQAPADNTFTAWPPASHGHDEGDAHHDDGGDDDDRAVAVTAHGIWARASRYHAQARRSPWIDAAHTQCLFDQGRQLCAHTIHDRDTMQADVATSGPCLVEDHATTTNVPEGWSAKTLPDGSLELVRN